MLSDLMFLLLYSLLVLIFYSVVRRGRREDEGERGGRSELQSETQRGETSEEKIYERREDTKSSASVSSDSPSVFTGTEVLRRPLTRHRNPGEQSRVFTRLNQLVRCYFTGANTSSLDANRQHE